METNEYHDPGIANRSPKWLEQVWHTVSQNGTDKAGSGSSPPLLGQEELVNDDRTNRGIDANSDSGVEASTELVGA